MRVAFLCDVHGNRPALEAVLPELERRGPFDAIVGGGDYITRGLDDAGVVTLLRDASWTAYLRGNSEDRVLGVAAAEGRIAGDGPRDGNAAENPLVRHALDHLDNDDLKFLAGTTVTWRAVGPSGQRLLCAHALPDDPYQHLWPDAPAEDVDQLLDTYDADVYLYGHIHLSYVRRTERGLIANAGTVGGPNRDWNLHPCFLLAEDTGEGWTLRHVTVPYDHEAHLRALIEAGIPLADGIVQAHRTHQWEVG